MKDLARLATFVLVVALAIRIQMHGDEAARKRLICQFLIVVFGLTMTAGLLRLDDWPFPAYPMEMYFASVDAEISEVVIRVVDSAGREVAPDPFSWSPLFMLNLAVWCDRHLPRLASSDQHVALAYLLQRAEEQRGRRAIGAAKWLGILAAPPDWGLYRRPRSTPNSYRAIRIYKATWRPSHPVKRLELLAAYEAH
jgi:hypothetical protein